MCNVMWETHNGYMAVGGYALVVFQWCFILLWDMSLVGFGVHSVLGQFLVGLYAVTCLWFCTSWTYDAFVLVCVIYVPSFQPSKCCNVWLCHNFIFVHALGRRCLSMWFLFSFFWLIKISIFLYYWLIWVISCSLICSSK